MGEHTKGPWSKEWRSGHARGMREVITANGVDRIAVISRAGVRTAVESEANGDLIAATPDLLAACEYGQGPDALLGIADALEDRGLSGYAHWLRKKAEAERAAIAKAKGEET